MRQAAIDSGERPGVPSQESVELRLARRRIRELEQELTIVRTAAKPQWVVLGRAVCPYGDLHGHVH